MGKVEDALRDLIYYHSKRMATDVLGDLPAQVRQMRRDVRALTRTVRALTSELRAVSKARRKERPVPPAPEGEVEKSRFSKRTLTSIRRRFDVTQQELAKLLEVSAVTIASWQRGKSRPRKGKLAQIVALRSMNPAAIDEAMGREPAPAAIKPDRIRRLRRKLGLTQAGLAKLVGVSAAAVTSWEAGRTAPGRGSRRALMGLKDTRQAPTGARPAAEGVPAARPAAEATGGLSPEDVRALRKQAGLSQSKLASTLGVSINTISNWETGRSTPRAKSMAKLLSMRK